MKKKNEKLLKLFIYFLQINSLKNLKEKIIKNYFKPKIAKNFNENFNILKNRDQNGKFQIIDDHFIKWNE